MGAGKKEAREEQSKDAKAKSTDDACKVEEKCDHPKIVKIEFLDGTDTTEIGGTTPHWVNLPRAAKWVDGTHVKNIDRLSHEPRAKVKFDRAGNHHFTVKVVPNGSNVAYTATEKARNTHFTYTETDTSFTTEDDGTAIIPSGIAVTAAGKHKFKLEAKDDHGGKVTSNEVDVHRLVYYLEVKMTGLTSIASSLGTFEAEYDKHRIKMVSLGSVNIARIANIGSDSDDTAFKDAARTAYAGSSAPAKEPYVLVVGYTDHLAVKNPNRTVVKSGVDVGPGKPAVVIPIQGPGLTNPAVKDRYLWKDLVPGEGWFVSCKFLKDGGTAGTDEVDIPEAKCTAAGSKCKQVSVDVTGLAAGRGSITLEVHWVDRMRGGLSYGGNSLIAICTRAWWADKSTAAQNQTLVHEAGHKVGMVADGGGSGPDKVSTHYDSSKGHVGDHCHDGIAAGQARYDSASDSSASACVMYGATNGKSAFCGNCAPAVIKQDLSGGWSAF